MNGDWLTLGAVGALAVASAARRGSADTWDSRVIDVLDSGICFDDPEWEDEVFYHSTPRRFLGAIMRGGLRPGTGFNFNLEGHGRGKVFLSAGFANAKRWQEFLSEQLGEDVAVLEVRLTATLGASLRVDDVSLEEGDPCAFYMTRSVPAKLLTVVDSGEGSADRSQGDLRHQILQAARKVCAVDGYLNCRLFVQLTSGTASLESIPIVSGPPQVGDVLQWGENPARHWAIFIGNGEVLEVPEWGGGLTTTPLHDVTDEYGPPRPAIRRLVWERGSSQRGSASAVARQSVYKQLDAGRQSER